MADRVWKGKPIKKFDFFKERFGELSDNYITLIEKTLKESKLDRKTQELVIIALLAHDFEDGFKFHLKEALRHGATRDEVVGVILLLLPYCSIGTFLTALNWAKEEGIL